MEIDSNKDKSKDHKKWPPPDVPKIVTSAVRHDSLKMLTKNHNDEELVITLLILVAGLIAYHLW